MTKLQLKHCIPVCFIPLYPTNTVTVPPTSVRSDVTERRWRRCRKRKVNALAVSFVFFFFLKHVYVHKLLFIYVSSAYKALNMFEHDICIFLADWLTARFISQI